MFKVGDRVKHKSCGYEGKVIAIKVYENRYGVYLEIRWDKYKSDRTFCDPVEDIVLIEKKTIKPYGIVEFMNKVNRKEYV
jgi:hypothetical protein